jgi:hypothetical protein
MKKNLKGYRAISDYVEVLDDLFLIYVESDDCDNDGQEYRSKVANCISELKTELVKIK